MPYAKAPVPQVYLELFHGRKSLADVMHDWGTTGPVLGPFPYVHTTYGNDLKCGESAVLTAHADCLYYDGVYYGDWSVFAARELTEEHRKHFVPFEQAKAISATTTTPA